VYSTTSSTSVAGSWTQLLDPTGEIEDMSFMFFTQPATTVSISEDQKSDTSDDSSGTAVKVEEKR